MINRKSLVRALVVIAALIPPTAARAQQDDADWMGNCRSDRGDRFDRRETYCEIRTATARPSGETVSMEGLRNGGVSVTGSDRGDIVVKTRIRAQARTMSEAKAIAGQVRTVISGSTITVDGPSRDDDDSQWSASLVASIPSRSNLRVETRNGPVSVRQVSEDG